MPVPRRIERYDLLDVMRGVTALCILTFHYGECFAPYGKTVHWLIAHTFATVLVFFVISGYSVTASMFNARAHGESPPSFLLRRYRRVYCPLWFSIAVSVVMGLATPRIVRWATHFPYPLRPEFAGFGAWDWLKYFTMIQVFFSGGQRLFVAFLPVNDVMWTLAIEVQLYFVMALMMFSKRRPLAAAIPLALVGFPMMFSLSIVNWGTFLPFWPVFGVGIVVYVCDVNGWTPSGLFKLSPRACAALMALAAVACVAATAKQACEGHPIFTSLVGVFFWLGLEFKGCFTKAARSANPLLRLASRVALLMGAMSYSIYLMHMVFYQAFKTLLSLAFPISSRWLGPMMVVAAVAIACPFHLYCEQPFIRSKIKANGAGARIDAQDG